MNDRIKELMNQTGVPVSMPFDKWCEKFAELIVRECIATVNRRYMGDNNREDMEVRRCVKDLKTHFGVD
jgi:hypothetical protein